MISMPTEVEEALVAACRYPPTGRRSFGPSRGLLYGRRRLLAHANAELLVLAMIERRAALDNLDAITDTHGLDGVYVGPNEKALIEQLQDLPFKPFEFHGFVGNFWVSHGLARFHTWRSAWASWTAGARRWSIRSARSSNG